MERRRLISYGPRLINILNKHLPILVMAENGLVGGSKDGPMAEATVQSLIVKLLAPHIPSPELIRNNEQALAHPELGRCIPDVIIDRIGFSNGAFEDSEEEIVELIDEFFPGNAGNNRHNENLNSTIKSDAKPSLMEQLDSKVASLSPISILAQSQSS